MTWEHEPSELRTRSDAQRRARRLPLNGHRPAPPSTPAVNPWSPLRDADHLTEMFLTFATGFVVGVLAAWLIL